MKKIILFTFFALTYNLVLSQTAIKERPTFYINVFINHNKNIWIESESVDFNKIKKEVKGIVYTRSFTLDEKIVYRIFADKDLQLGYIMDVEEELFNTYNDDKTRRERYLLETVKQELDGPNWFKQLESRTIIKVKD